MGSLRLRIGERLSLRKRRPDLPALRELIGDARGLRIVDLGGGSGLLTDTFAPSDALAIVLEPDSEKLSYGRTHHPRIRFVHGRAEDLPLADASMDRAIGIVSLHHVERPDRALDETRRVLRPGGRIVFLELYPERPGLLPRLFFRHGHGGGPHFLAPDDLRETLTRRGFRDAVVRPGTHGYFVAATR